VREIGLRRARHASAGRATVELGDLPAQLVYFGDDVRRAEIAELGRLPFEDTQAGLFCLQNRRLVAHKGALFRK
jgi:hypothetical protein